MALAYCEEHQRFGLSWTALQSRLGRSRRTIASLSKRITESGFSIDGSALFHRQRSIVDALGAGPTETPIINVGAGLEHVQTAIAALVDAETVVHDGSRYSLNTGYVDQMGESFEKRFDGLRHFMDTVAQVAHQRL